MKKIVLVILREMAQKEQLKHEIIRELLSSPFDQMNKIEKRLIQNTTNHIIEFFNSNHKFKSINFQRVAERTWEVLPLILEHEAISNFINKNHRYALRRELPELTTTKAAIEYLQEKYPYDSPSELELIEWSITRLDQNLPYYSKLGYFST